MATVTPIRTRKPNRRRGALPAAPVVQAPLPQMTPEQAARWLAIYEAESARRGLPPLGSR
jgi:hypothetical protein